ncbi:T9SS type A sorting domain-containing protein [Hyphobacterium sp. CCMP332]|nr:T9SS type A sorting domain-containing protein [Hyphobacterium sp. CCMP332]
MISRIVNIFPKHIYLAFIGLFIASLVEAQEHELSHKPANYNQDYFLNEPLPNLEVLCLPNPTYDTTTFEYELKEAGEVSLKIYNDMGHKIDEPFKEFREAGTYTIQWSPLNLKLKGGVYYARVGLGDKYRLLKVRYIE